MMRSEKPLIALVTPSLGLGGAEMVQVALGTEFLSRGYRIDYVFGWDRGTSDGLLPPASRAVCLEQRRLRHYVRPLAAYLRRERPAVMMASMWPLTSWAVIANKLAGGSSRVAVCDHNNLSMQYQNRGTLHRLALGASIAASYPFADARIAVSDGVAQDVARLSGLGVDRFDVVHNPLSAHLGASQLTSVARTHRRRIITVGRCKFQKNHALLVTAFARIATELDLELMLLGDGELAEQTTALAVKLGIADRFLMPGFAKDPAPYYQSSDLFVLSSNYEGFGNVIVEALSFGLPVVSTDCPSGPADILDNGRYGRLVPVGDDVALADAMRQALETEHDREALKRRARDFSLDQIADRYLSILMPEKSRNAEFKSGERVARQDIAL